jgi:large subunit ribosomal protein L6
MSRVAKSPIVIPKGVDVSVANGMVTLKGSKGTLSTSIHPLIEVQLNDGVITVVGDRADRKKNALAGTTRANIANMVTGVSAGYERKLTLVGVGYRAQAKGQSISLTLGFSHPIEFKAPDGITLETPSQTEILVRGCDKQQVGQVAANLRSYRPPEPYKGKGVRYSDEEIVRKEAKKK